MDTRFFPLSIEQFVLKRPISYTNLIKFSITNQLSLISKYHHNN